MQSMCEGRSWHVKQCESVDLGWGLLIICEHIWPFHLPTFAPPQSYEHHIARQHFSTIRNNSSPPKGLVNRWFDFGPSQQPKTPPVEIEFFGFGLMLETNSFYTVLGWDAPICNFGNASNCSWYCYLYKKQMLYLPGWIFLRTSLKW